MNSMDRYIINQFLKLPSTSFPSAQTMMPDSDLEGHEWDVLRKFDGSVTYSETIVLRADVDGWRNGVSVII
jgi:hypothetical protein